MNLSTEKMDANKFGIKQIDSIIKIALEIDFEPQTCYTDLRFRSENDLKRGQKQALEQNIYTQEATTP